MALGFQAQVSLAELPEPHMELLEPLHTPAEHLEQLELLEELLTALPPVPTELPLDLV